jgi:phosphoglycerol transferase MdoB-like AlkP superfamily enzyme
MKNYRPQKEIIFFILLCIVGIVFFEFFRLVFLLRNFNLADEVPFWVLVESFLVGLRFDMVITCYVIAPFFIVGNMPLFELFSRKLFRNILFIPLITLFIIVYFLTLVDIEFFRQFNSRLNYFAVSWLDTPFFVIKMIWEMYPVVWYLFFFTLAMIGFVILVKKILKKIDRFNYKPNLMLRTLYFFIFSFLVFLGMRGRIHHKSPIRWGNAYFSDYNFANQMALNPVFTFGNAIIENIETKNQKGIELKFYSISDAVKHTQELLKIKPAISPNYSLTREVIFNPKNSIKYNVVLILMESFGSNFIGAQGGEIDLTPNFNKLCKNGILFTNFFSNGMHTYTGIFSSIIGMPTPPGKSIMIRTAGQKEFLGLGSILRNNGYETLFFCTHDPVFDNMAGFLRNNGFKKIIGEEDYSRELVLSTLGVPDHIMFEKAVNVLSEIKDKPFFAFILTATNHGPWLVPEVDFGKVDSQLPEAKKFNAFKYSDWALGRFIELSQKQNYFKDTIFIIAADSGLLYKPKYDLDISAFHIPLLIYAPHILGNKQKRINTFGGQVDMLPTVMGILKLNYMDNTLGRNLFALKEDEGFAQFTEGKLNGLIDKRFFLIDRIGVNASLYEYNSKNPTEDLALSKKNVLQNLQTDLRAYLQMSDYILGIK